MGNMTTHCTPLPDCVQELVAKMQDIPLDAIVESIKDCDSPIEQMFALQLLSLEETFPSVAWSKQDRFNIFGRKYRTDFVLQVYDAIFDDTGTPAYEWTTGLVVECDGMEYHSDKEQIEHDNTRDIDFLMKYGMPTVRFTGSQILKGSWGSAGRAMRLVIELNEKKRDEFGSLLKAICGREA